MNRRPRKDDGDEFGDFESEMMKFVLHLVRQLRLAFEAAAASKWVALWACSAALAGSATSAAKSLFLP